MVDDVWARTAARFRKPAPRWRSPAELAAALDPDWRLTPALKLIDDALVDVAEGRCGRLIIALSPQEGKTSLVAQAFLLWWLTYRRDSRCAIASYEQEIAQRNGRRIRDLIAQHDGTDGTLDLGLRVRRGDHAAARWTLENHAGGLVCVGVGAALTGQPVTGVLVIDDPTKDHEQAMSTAHRERVWDWWRSTARTRLSRDAAVVLIATRWHAEDLTGKLLADGAEPWRVISIPAIADSPDDLLGREIGEPMVSARGRTLDDWESTRRAVGEFTWAALYQQRPSPVGGGLFRVAKIKHWQPVLKSTLDRPAISLDGQEVYLETLHKFLTVDLAASTKTSADFTAIAVWGITMDGSLILLDGTRMRIDPSEHWTTARQLRDKWSAGTVHIESASFGATMTYEAGRDGVPIGELKPDKDKFTRAMPAAARADAGRLFFPSLTHAPWVQDWLDELAAFPAGAHDDTVDCLGYAARVAAAHWLPMESAAQEAARRPRYDPDQAEMDAVFGPEIDFTTAQW